MTMGQALSGKERDEKEKRRQSVMAMRRANGIVGGGDDQSELGM